MECRFTVLWNIGIGHATFANGHGNPKLNFMFYGGRDAIAQKVNDTIAAPFLQMELDQLLPGKENILCDPIVNIFVKFIAFLFKEFKFWTRRSQWR